MVMDKKAATIFDVARTAGVSIATVSHVLNNSVNVADKTKVKVLEAIEKLSYSPNDAARSIRTGKTKSIGIIVPDIMNEYYSNTMQSFLKAAYSKEYTVLLTCCENNIRYEEKLIRMLLDRRVEAIGIMGGKNDEDLIREVMSKVPILLIDRRIENSGLSCIQFDNFTAMRELISVLHKAGYTEIGYMSESVEMVNISDRYHGFIQGMEESGLTVNDKYIYISKELQLNKNMNGKKLMTKLLKEKGREKLPKVLLTSSDLIAAGVMDAIKEAGYTIPKDFGIIGFDNIMLSNYTYPALTTVQQDTEMMGKTSWDIIYQLIKRKAKIHHDIVLEQKLIFRDSCIL